MESVDCESDLWYDLCMQDLPGAIQAADEGVSTDTPSPVPSSTFQNATSTPLSSLTPVICDGRVISRLLETLLHRAGLTPAAAARALGVRPQAVQQYLGGRRTKPSLLWFVKLAEVCGARVYVEFPKRRG